MKALLDTAGLRASPVVLLGDHDRCGDGLETRRFQPTLRDVTCRQCCHLAVFVHRRADLLDVTRQQQRLRRRRVQASPAARQVAHDVVHVTGDAENDGEDHDAAVVAADQQRAIVGADAHARGERVHERARLALPVRRPEHEQLASVRRQCRHVATVDDQLHRVRADDVTDVKGRDLSSADDLVEPIGAVQRERHLSRERDAFDVGVGTGEVGESLQQAVPAHVVNQRAVRRRRPVYPTVGAVPEVTRPAAVDDDDVVVAEGLRVDEDVVISGVAPQLVQQHGVGAAPLPAEAVHAHAHLVLRVDAARLLLGVDAQLLLLHEHQVTSGVREERLADDVTGRHLQPLHVATVDVETEAVVGVERPVGGVAVLALEEDDLPVTWSEHDVSGERHCLQQLPCLHPPQLVFSQQLPRAG